MKTVRRIFITGLLVLIPIVGTISLIAWLFNIVDSIFRVPIEKIIGFRIIGIGFILTISIIFATGIFATNYLGKEIICLIEKTMSRIPLVNTIYLSIKKLIDAFCMKQKGDFKSTVLVQYPSKGIYTIGFITADVPNEVSEKVGENMKSIFVPTTPNPTSGMFIMVSTKDIIPLDISVESAIKLVVSGGILLPERKK
ncbi:DUF502 domain-containing protein [Crassaminicella thermophila]|uniref:DUF502 domain-containing protein n=1 Tax=Crassaminicella thermophila TaxID=2599308 RepID=A0A5C0SCU6_CRATE|nr:DUF502 domain-containing protein [Crassaminicella thermophila]QEK12355.1 DUF502 domain-containing protein [Crassaminicella thermophila]